MYLCPNDLSLGRITSRVLSGPFRETSGPEITFEVYSFSESGTLHGKIFVKAMYSLSKMPTRLEDSGWKLGTVLKAFPAGDGRIRKVQVQ